MYIIFAMDVCLYMQIINILCCFSVLLFDTFLNLIFSLNRNLKKKQKFEVINVAKMDLSCGFIYMPLFYFQNSPQRTKTFIRK